MASKKKKSIEIVDYDSDDTSTMIDAKKKLNFADIGFQLPATPPTQVISIRLPSKLLNELKALGSEDDVPYQVLIKMMLAEGVRQKSRLKRSA